MNDYVRITQLVNELNIASDAYYNSGHPIMSDKEFDTKFDTLKELEKNTGIILSGSPTQNVGYAVHTKLKKKLHEFPMLSLDKTKEPDELIRHIGDKDGLLMFKADGLTICLTYIDGELICAETRGNGIEGIDCTDNVKTFDNVPLHINCREKVVVFGEAIVMREDFEKINSQLCKDERFKTQRNMASGSVLQLDSAVCKQRHLKFVAWRYVTGTSNNSFLGRLKELQELGFMTIPVIQLNKHIDKLLIDIVTAKDSATYYGFPIDGLVAGFDDVRYGDNLGNTAHHRRAELAFKYNEDVEETELINIEWSMGKQGSLTPVLNFDPVELDGTTVERASAHNLTILKKLGIKQHSILKIVKKNDIIPQCIESYGGDRDIEIPSTCPICGEKTIITQDNNSEVLMCSNDDCHGKLLGKLTHFVSKDAMNIEGLSEATIQIFIQKGWVNNFLDIYNLKSHYSEMIRLNGFGKRSVDKLIAAIEESVKNVKLENFITALSIPNVGKSTAKDISKHFGENANEFLKSFCSCNYEWDKINGIGSKTKFEINEWSKSHKEIIQQLHFLIDFEEININTSKLPFKNMTFVITGSLNKYKNRAELINIIECNGGKIASSVSTKTTYLINNDSESNSSKNKKAKQLNIPIITEEDFMKLIEG